MFNKVNLADGSRRHLYRFEQSDQSYALRNRFYHPGSKLEKYRIETREMSLLSSTDISLLISNIDSWVQERESLVYGNSKAE